MKAKIMLVDDEPSFRLLVQSLLVKEGYEVTEAGSCSSLRQALAGPPPNLVLLDLYLPDGNGLDVLPDLRLHWPNTKVIILTGHPGAEAAEDAYRLGEVLWLNKPFDAAMLKAMIGVALG
jgi:DNA-binding NtrC family response regulator